MPSSIQAALDDWFALELKRIQAPSPEIAAKLKQDEAELEKWLIAEGERSGLPRALNTAGPVTVADRPADKPSFIIVGAGVGGICMAVKLVEAGFDDFLILEKAEDLGGTWHHNRYPGIACDVNSYLYQFGFFKKIDWTSSTPSGAEIQQYLKDVARHYGVDKHIRFGAEVQSCTRTGGKWNVALADGETHAADVLISAVGFLHYPNPPAFEGMDSFQGTSLHSSRWTADVAISGKRVGMIGNGSSAVQIVPRIIDDVSELKVFQRTAQWLFPAPRDYYSPSRIEMLSMYPDLVHRLYDFYMKWYSEVFGNAVVGDKEGQQFFLDACAQNLASVSDPALREKLSPPDPIMCKRLVFGDGYYEALQSPKSSLVTEAIERVEPTGIRTADGTLHELDVIIYATGYKTHEYCRRLNVSVEGGRTLEDAWTSGARTMDSVAVAGFPNFFILGGPYSTAGSLSTMTCSGYQADFIVDLISGMIDAGAVAVTPTAEAEQEFVQDMQSVVAGTTWASGCNSWYLDEHGKLDIWVKTPREYLDRMIAGPDPAHYALLADEKKVLSDSVS